MAKSKKKKRARKPYGAADVKLLKQHSKAKTPVAKIVKEMKRSEGSLRQKALTLGIGLERICLEQARLCSLSEAKAAFEEVARNYRRAQIAG